VWRKGLAVLPQAFWGALLVIHLPIFVAVASSIVVDGPTLSRICSLLGLVVAMAFFLLKLGDVSFLRLRTRQQSFVVVCLLTAIVHSNAIAPDMDRAIVIQGAAALVTSSVAHEWLRRRPCRPGWAARLAASLAPPRLLLSPAQPCDRDTWSPPPRWIPTSPSVPRAPPL
jgi:peptidoglycan/LPS O-acetylase OafA/YrhL